MRLSHCVFLILFLAFAGQSFAEPICTPLDNPAGTTFYRPTGGPCTSTKGCLSPSRSGACAKGGKDLCANGISCCESGTNYAPWGTTSVNIRVFANPSSGSQHCPTGTECLKTDTSSTSEHTCVTCPAHESYDSTVDACTCDYGYSRVAGICQPVEDCPGNQEEVGVGNCSCPAGMVIDEATGNCHEPCENSGDTWVHNPADGSGYEGTCFPPDAENCPEGTESVPGVGGGPPMCAWPDPEPEDEPCEDIAGYIDGHEVCNDDLNECKETGGSYGWVNDAPVCVPDIGGETPPNIPDCTASEGLVYTPANTSQPWTCEHLEGSPSEQPPSETPPNDADDDGIPDGADPDIDGDGTPNGSDSDRDGDGISNGNDPCPNTVGDCSEGSDDSVSGGGNCEAAPECQGDAIQCAILDQQWKTRCEGKLSGADQCVTEPSCAGSPTQCAALLQEWRLSCAFGEGDPAALADAFEGNDPSDLDGDEADGDLETILGGVYSSGSPGGTCPAPYSLSMAGQTFAFSYQPVFDLAGALRPVVLLIFGLLAFRTIMRAF